MSSFLGAGDSSHKIGGTEGPSDTAYLGVFRRDALLSVNGYNVRSLSAIQTMT